METAVGAKPEFISMSELAERNPPLEADGASWSAYVGEVGFPTPILGLSLTGLRFRFGPSAASTSVRTTDSAPTFGMHFIMTPL